MNAEDTEKRKNTRVAFRTEVEVSTLDETFLARADTRDISLQGVFLRTDRKLPLNQHCDLQIKLTGASSVLSICAKGRVVRQDDNGVGIVFEGVDLDSYFHLKNLLLYNADDPREIEHEAPL